MIKYWFYLEPYTYIKIINQEVFLYNTLDGNVLTSINANVVELILSVSNPKNLGVVLVILETEGEVFRFIEKIRNYYMGDIIPVELSQKKPIQLMPLLRIENEVNFNKETTANSYTENVLENLSEITLIVGGDCGHHCKYCETYYEQFDCCSKVFVDNKYLKYSILEGCLSKIKDISSVITCLNIVFTSDTSWLSSSNRCFSLLADIKSICHLNINYLNIGSLDRSIVDFFDNRINIIIDVSLYQEHPIPIKKEYCLIWIVKSIDEVKYVRDLNFSNNEIITPFFQGHNLSFFEDYIFVEKEDFKKTPVSFRRIHQNQKINMLSFGKLYILPDASVKTNLGGSLLGNLCQDSFLDIISRALMNEQSSWLKTRKHYPCCGCFYQDLCPPISNYEYVLNKFNLCHIKINNL